MITRRAGIHALGLAVGTGVMRTIFGDSAFATQKSISVKLVGYNDMHEMLVAISSRIERRYPWLTIELDLPSTRSAPPALLSGASLLAPMGAPMDQNFVNALRERWGGSPLKVRVAHDSLKAGALSSPTGILVHRSNPLGSISMPTARRAFFASGANPAIQTWSQLGVGGEWADRPIHFYGLSSTTALGQYFSNTLDAAGLAPRFQGFDQSRKVAEAISGDPLGMGFGNLNHAGGRCHAIGIVDNSGALREPTEAVIQSGRYPFNRFLLIYARRNADGTVDPMAHLILREILSPEGQAVIGAGSLGYLPLNETERRAQSARLEAASPKARDPANRRPGS